MNLDYRLLPRACDRDPMNRFTRVFTDAGNVGKLYLDINNAHQYLTYSSKEHHAVLIEGFISGGVQCLQDEINRANGIVGC